MWKLGLFTVHAALFNCFAPLYNDELGQRAAPIGASLVFAAFGHVNASCELDFETPGEDQKLRNLLFNNPNVLLSLGWGKQDIPMIERCPLKFATSVARFVALNNLRGFDIDHENPPFSSERNFITVSTSLRNALPPPLLLTITPASLYNLHIPTVNSLYDFVNAQTYWSTIAPFIDAGLRVSTLFAGVDIESGEFFDEAVLQVKTFGLAGAFAWTFARNLSQTIQNMKQALESNGITKTQNFSVT